MPPKLPKYKYLITYRLSEIIFDLVDDFILKYLSALGDLSYLSLKDQMLKCARSIKQNIIEGVSEIASLKSQIKLLGVAYGSVEELIADLEDFARRKGLSLYPKNHPQVVKYRTLGTRLSHLSNLGNLGQLKEKPALPPNLEEATNLLLTLCHQLSFLLKRQIQATEKKFIENGGYSENLFQKRLNYRKLPKSPRLLRSFTLMEILIFIALIALLATALLVLLNPKKQIEKAWDGKRKKELNTLQKVFEDWYNDKNCYPKPQEICYQVISETEGYICGNENSSPNFSPYLNKIPCDPQHPSRKYLYQVDNSQCPSGYKIYALLSELPNNGAYNYLVSAGNVDSSTAYPTLIPQPTSITPTPTRISTPTISITQPLCPADPTSKYCFKYDICNNCGSFSSCQQPNSCNLPLQLYSNSTCSQPCRLPN
jgi:four helix bundle suffix protein